jgi:pimeloyl-ACP methyl ester carboxylesterase
LNPAYIDIGDSPLRPGAGSTRIYYRQAGAGTPLVYLHGGWGYEVYPFDNQIAAMSGRYRILIPDRSGYGRSSDSRELPADFHQRAAVETLRFLDALKIRRAALWGHSDGAVIAALLGLAAPERFTGLILEAFHYGPKTGSLDWMRSVMLDPDTLGERTKSALLRDHGERWREVVRRNAGAWLEIGRVGALDLYGGKLGELAVPTLFIHGGGDRRTEPGELDAMRRALPRAGFRIIEGAGHCPHSGLESAQECTRIAAEFLDRLVRQS